MELQCFSFDAGKNKCFFTAEFVKKSRKVDFFVYRQIEQYFFGFFEIFEVFDFFDNFAVVQQFFRRMLIFSF